MYHPAPGDSHKGKYRHRSIKPENAIGLTLAILNPYWYTKICNAEYSVTSVYSDTGALLTGFRQGVKRGGNYGAEKP
jgi:hypothetical protein